ncbi:MAG: lipopolysaccharide core heptose(II) kinase RfaY [Owenweeksia sp.]|nr:lipopolysaccharide core heptose(II) kinase RfaY [Owenweeksia sp.]
MFNISKSELEHYLLEVEQRLLEETNYEVELQRSMAISDACSHIENLRFPKYYPEYSAGRVLTMEWLDGNHLDDFLKSNPSPELRNRVGQALWDFYDFQVHQLHEVHADPHPGNFLISKEGRVEFIDFGCVKKIDAHFHRHYLHLLIRRFIRTTVHS